MSTTGAQPAIFLVADPYRVVLLRRCAALPTLIGSNESYFPRVIGVPAIHIITQYVRNRSSGNYPGNTFSTLEPLTCRLCSDSFGNVFRLRKITNTNPIYAQHRSIRTAIADDIYPASTLNCHLLSPFRSAASTSSWRMEIVFPP
ncbi:hypothetical protein SERLA73DRAFT_79521 [Serpula lacrymans var. lacrymans S7.3]|uniref:Uncharacterized protein n=2 Tax=Serpula lacrymans var. lacrymans TaxID=341189 RepID=F8QGQ3_SERL3|nr:uncharacterized protein SERLADRAFT_433447 [Serpula lacrymans var. lacrymans S7.9]EGN92486.1 hypothetical protein SERLA73DRAFT_79521 [Serpula lacrymans var. lacrymans S7.3]EGO29468.1 hypothetical protein SERLADRAFT_433447 [Serpula lacrymans var. lacrymans S7.9]